MLDPNFFARGANLLSVSLVDWRHERPLRPAGYTLQPVVSARRKVAHEHTGKGSLSLSPSSQTYSVAVQEHES